MTTMVERVARAIGAVQLWTRYNDWTSDHVPGKPIEVCRYGESGEPEVIDRFPFGWDEESEFPKLISKYRARAAIEAMMEPTEDMLMAGRDVGVVNETQDIYSAMIQAALKEGQ